MSVFASRRIRGIFFGGGISEWNGGSEKRKLHRGGAASFGVVVNELCYLTTTFCTVLPALTM